MNVGAYRIVSALAFLVIGAGSLVATAAAPAKGVLTVHATRPASADIRLSGTERILTRPSPVSGAADARVTFGGQWAFIRVATRAGRIEYEALYDRRLSQNPLVLVASRPLGAGMYRITLAGDRAVTASFDLTGGSQSRTQTASGPTTVALLTSPVQQSPGGFVATARVRLKIVKGSVVSLISYRRTSAGQATTGATCLTTPDGLCPVASPSGRWVNTSPGASATSDVNVDTYTSLQRSEYDAVADFETVGLVDQLGLLALIRR